MPPQPPDTPDPREVSRVAQAIEKVTGSAKRMGTAFKKSVSSIGLGSIKARVEAEKLGAAIQSAEESAIKAWKAEDKASAQAHQSTLRHLQDQKKRIDTWNQFKGTVSSTAKGLLTAASATTVYHRNLEEIRFGQRLFLADLARVGPEAEKSYGLQNKYIDGMRIALSKSNTIARQFGTTGEEVDSVVKDLGFSLRGQIKDIDKMGPTLQLRTRELYAYARSMNVDVKDALEEFKSELYDQGRSQKAARSEMLDSMITHQKLQKRMEKLGMATKGSADIWREDWAKTLRDVKKEMPGILESNRALGEVMGSLYIEARKAGMSYNEAIQAMAQTPKLLKGLPDFFKIQVGGKFLAQARDPRRRKELLSALAPGDPNDPEVKAARERFNTTFTSILTTRGLAPGERERMIGAALSGTELGIQAVLGQWKKMAPAFRAARIKELIGEEAFEEGGTGRAMLSAIEAGGAKGTAAMKDIMAKAKAKAEEAKKQREALRKSQVELPKRMKEQLDLSKKLILQTDEALGVWKDITKSNWALVIALGLNTTAQMKGAIASMASWFAGGGTKLLAGLAARTGITAVGQGIGAAAGRAGGSIAAMGGGGVAGAATTVAGVAIAGAMGYKIGEYLDKRFKISDKVSDALVEGARKAAKERTRVFAKEIASKAYREQAEVLTKWMLKGRKTLEVTKVEEGKLKTGQRETIELTAKSIQEYMERRAKATGVSKKDIGTMAKLVEQTASTAREYGEKGVLKRTDTLARTVAQIPQNVAKGIKLQAVPSTSKEMKEKARIQAESAARLGGTATEGGAIAAEAGGVEVPTDFAYDSVSKQVTLKFGVDKFAAPVAAANRMINGTRARR